MEYDLIIIGSGPAGATAAIYAKRFGLKVLVFSCPAQPSQITWTSEIENYPTYKMITGTELMEKMIDHVKFFNVEIIEEPVVDMKLDGEKEVMTESGKKYKAKSIIIATGAHHRTAGVKGEKELMGKGVSYCYTCDGPFFKGKKVLVVGGGDSAFTGALYLKDIGCDVSIVHRRDEFKATPIYIERAKKENIEFITPRQIKEILGKEKVEGVILDDGRKIDCEGVFILIGEIPSVEIFKKAGIKTNEGNFILVDENKKTNIDGVYAAGDVTVTPLRQIITACSDGAIAALNAFKFVKGG